jgi:AcrR family transcriptional regulator
MAGPSDASQDPVSDGRALRSERSREAIVGAILELVKEGDLQPTAERVADRANVGIRTVFRHFSDMESLFVAMRGRLSEQLEHLLAVKPAMGGLGSRIDAFIQARTALSERMLPYLRSTHLLRWRSDFLQTQYVRDSRDLRNQMVGFFPELNKAPADLLEAMDYATSLEAWDRLRDLQGLSRARAAAVQRRTIEAVLAQLKG